MSENDTKSPTASGVWTQRYPNGSLVRLRSGGPIMTVIYGGTDGPLSLGDDRTGYACEWFDADGAHHKHAFREDSLTSADGCDVQSLWSTMAMRRSSSTRDS